MASTEAQSRASMKYMKEKVKRSIVSFYPAEQDIWEYLNSQPNKQGYIKSLIRADMEKHRS